MALKHLSTILCEHILVDADGRFTAIQTFQNIAHPGPFPAVKAPFNALIEVRGEGERVAVALEGPPGKQILLEGVADKKQGVSPFQLWAATIRITLGALPFPEPGIYSIVIYSGDEEVHRREFGVFQASPESAGAQNV